MEDDPHAGAAEKRHELEVEDEGFIGRIDSAFQHALEQARVVVLTRPTSIANTIPPFRPHLISMSMDLDSFQRGPPTLGARLAPHRYKYTQRRLPPMTVKITAAITMTPFRNPRRLTPPVPSPQGRYRASSRVFRVPRSQSIMQRGPATWLPIALSSSSSPRSLPPAATAPDGPWPVPAPGSSMQSLGPAVSRRRAARPKQVRPLDFVSQSLSTRLTHSSGWETRLSPHGQGWQAGSPRQPPGSWEPSLHHSRIVHVPNVSRKS